MVTRSVVQATRMKSDGDGYFNESPIAGQLAVCYGVGGTEPLQLEKVQAANLKQFDVSVACFDQYISLLKTATGRGLTV